MSGWKLDTEETCKRESQNKQRRENCSGRGRCNGVKPWNQHWLQWGGGLEKKVVGDSPLLMSEELVKGITQ